MHNPPTSERRTRLACIVRRSAGVTLTSAVLLLTTAQMASAAPAAAVNVSTSGLNGWIQNNIVNLGLLLIGAVIIFRGKSKDWSGALVTGGIAIVGLVFVAMGTGTSALGVGQWLLGLIGVGGGSA